MDFGTLLHVAKRNSEDVKTSENKYYSTKFSAPKKESKDKKLSDNIKKFLAKKEQEEREKAREEKQKREQLLAMRDERAKNKIKKMLKVIKSANKSVLEDAIDTENTAVTLQGPDQPDEDDYGYVSKESSAFYAKYMDRVKALPEEDKFAKSRPASKTDLAGTKDRVRAAIIREQEEMASGSRSKSSASSSSSTTPSSSSSSSHRESSSSSSRSTESHISTSSRRKDLYDPQAERDAEEKKRREEAKQRAKSRPAQPPPMDFHQLLKLAEKKQHEPLEIEVVEKKKEERLLTKKEKREIEDQERRKREKALGLNYNGNKMQPNGRIPKLNGAGSTSTSSPSGNDKGSKPPQRPSDSFKKPMNPGAPNGRLDAGKSRPDVKTATTSSSSATSNGLKPKSSQPNGISSRPSDSSRPSSSSSQPKSAPTSSSLKPATKSSASASSSSSSSSATQKSSQSKQPYNGPTREFPPRDSSGKKPSQAPSAQGRSNGNAASRDVQKTRQFPPPDVRRRPEPPRKQQQQPVKRRIYDDYDDDSEYDSELDDFIDDGPEEGANYSSYIKEIFGYDKSRYRDVDEDDAAMESSFAQQMREEFVSKKIGLLEDLEDMRMEEEEKKRKRLMKKRKLK